MGVVNVTPDSFSDGGSYLDPDAAIAHGLALAAAGAAVIDVGGESTRPGADPGRRRRGAAPGRCPVDRGAGRRGPRFRSASTRRRPSWRAPALDAGARDGERRLGRDRRSRHPARRRRRGRRVRRDAHARNAADDAAARRTTPMSSREVGDELRGAGRRARSRPASTPARCFADPGIGFAEDRASTTSRCCARCPRIAARVGVPLLVGTSRKSFLARDRSATTVGVGATTPRSRPRSGVSSRAPRSCACTTSPRRARAVALLEALERATPEGMAA